MSEFNDGLLEPDGPDACFCGALAGEDCTLDCTCETCAPELNDPDLDSGDYDNDPSELEPDDAD